jgi:hypothetical protein
MHIEQDTNSALQQVVDRVRTLLVADSAIVFAPQEPAYMFRGSDHLSNQRFATFVSETRLADLIYQQGPVYLQNKSQYRNFVSVH